MVKMTTDLIDIETKLSAYPHILKYIQDNWCTVRLKEYLEDLLTDTRDDSRAGFPTEVSSALLSISLSNIFCLENKGLTFDAPDENGFGDTKWDLPKNF
jgi:hypothetical protein